MLCNVQIGRTLGSQETKTTNECFNEVVDYINIAMNDLWGFVKSDGETNQNSYSWCVGVGRLRVGLMASKGTHTSTRCDIQSESDKNCHLLNLVWSVKINDEQFFLKKLHQSISTYSILQLLNNAVPPEDVNNNFMNLVPFRNL